MGIRGGGRATQKKVRLLGLFLVDSLRRDLYSRAIGACLPKYLEHSVKALVKIDPHRVDVYERAVLRAARLSSASLCALADAHGDARTPELVYFAYGGDKPRVMAFVCKTPRDATELVDCAKFGLVAAAATAKAGGFVDRQVVCAPHRSTDEVARSDTRRQRPPSPDARSSLSEHGDRPAYRRYASQTAKRSSSERRAAGATRSGDSAAYSSDSAAAFDGVGGGRPSRQNLSRAMSQPAEARGVAGRGSGSLSAGTRPPFGRRRSAERAQPEAASASSRRGAATLDGRLRTSYDYIRQRPTAAYGRETSEDDLVAVDSPTGEGGRSLAFASHAEDSWFQRLNPASSGARLTGSHRYARTTSYDQGAAAGGRSAAVHWKPVDRHVLGSTAQRTISVQ